MFKFLSLSLLVISLFSLSARADTIEFKKNSYLPLALRGQVENAAALACADVQKYQAKEKYTTTPDFDSETGEIQSPLPYYTTTIKNVAWPKTEDGWDSDGYHPTPNNEEVVSYVKVYWVENKTHAEIKCVTGCLKTEEGNVTDTCKTEMDKLP